MASVLDSVVPWGWTFDEYVGMFGLTEEELRLGIVSCGDGPASFNREMHARGMRVISCDAIYRFSG